MVVLFLCYTCYNESRGEIYVSFYTFHDITLLEPGLRIRVELIRIRPSRETVSGSVPRKNPELTKLNSLMTIFCRYKSQYNDILSGQIKAELRIRVELTLARIHVKPDRDFTLEKHPDLWFQPWLELQEPSKFFEIEFRKMQNKNNDYTHSYVKNHSIFFKFLIK